MQLKPKQALNKAFFKIKPNRDEIEGFKTNLIQLLDRINDTESEEFHKNLVSDFLKKTYYDPKHFINTKGRNDLVIHNGNNASSSVGVIIEAKKITNKAEMITTEKLNKKAFQELVLYYLRERITHKNLEIKHLVVTNINEWFIFDAVLFDRLFAQNKNLVKQFTDFEGGRLAGTKTDFFYKQIAEPFIADIKTEIEFTYFDLEEYQKPLRNADKSDDNKLIALFKLLSAEHLLKLPFANDSNSLDKSFYSELLHIIGLTETKEGSKKLIERNKEGERNSGSILEDAIIQLDSLDKLNRLDQPSQFGNTQAERLLNVALELSITWINRILFLKLLEAQLITYHKGDKAYSFLSLDKIKNYDDLNSLFFQVLARKYDDRNQDVKKAFEKVPYLNSSLFEPTEIEQVTLFISNLKDDKTIPIISSTVLKNDQGKKCTGNLNTLEYLFDFLNAYDFASEGSEEIQEDNKTLINASVLGLIFEKINGYKDGSFFTPGFITMYMCRETIRKSVVQKFNETKKWNCSTIEELYDKIEDRKEANDIVNSIKICDPAVGSGHFLVSALNEMIAVKNDLKILQDRTGKRLKEYQVEVVNDELIVTDEEGELFEYNPTRKESQRIQESLFHEKQTIIENCLFGVDINPNSVKICQLRLWIELLKNAYYKNTTELETLPNIDINIKCGNSLISRYSLNADLNSILKSRNISIEEYKKAVQTYQNAENKQQKREVKKFIESIRKNFKQELLFTHPVKAKVNNLEGELDKLQNQISLDLGTESEKQKKESIKKQEQLNKQIIKVKQEIEDLENNIIFENAFEWRFEFPEVLDESGNFIGFDVVIGNPPYIRQEEIKDIKLYLKNNYAVFNSIADIYTYFIERANSILNTSGHFVFIISNKFTRANYGESLRNYLLKNTQLNSFIDFSGIPIFDNATVDAAILSFRKNPQFNPQPPESFNPLAPLTVSEVPPNPLNRGNSEDFVPLQNSVKVSSGLLHIRNFRNLSDQVDSINIKENNLNDKTPPVKGAGGYSMTKEVSTHFEHGGFLYSSEIKELADKMRKAPTPAEKYLWDNILRSSQLGFKFIRQKPIHNFILDFYCSELLLGIEADGDIHDLQEEQDQLRTEYFESIGIKIIRFRNEEILKQTEEVKTEILNYIKNVPPNPLNRGNSDDQVNCTNHKYNTLNSETPPVKGAGGYLGVGGLTYCNIQKDFLNKLNVYDYIEINKINFPISQLENGNWAFANDEKLQIKHKVESQGKPLKNWDIEINYGIKTGFNEAFVIDEKKKNELITKDPKCAEIIKPLLRGRDIQKWKPEFADLWLIGTFPTLKLNIEEYPSLKEHLLSFGISRLEQSGNSGARKKTSNKWFETQDNIAYWKHFEEPKIVYPNMTKFLPFIYDESQAYTNQKCFILTGEKLKYLIAFLNSNLFKYTFKDNFPELLGGTRELSKIFFEQISVKIPSPEQEKNFNERVDEILKLKQADPNAEISHLEKEIDLLVYKLYDLTEEEIQLIEN